MLLLLPLFLCVFFFFFLFLRLRLLRPVLLLFLLLDCRHSDGHNWQTRTTPQTSNMVLQ